MNMPTVAEKRPVLEHVKSEEQVDQQVKTYKHKDTFRILFPGIGHPLVVLLDFIQIKFPHLVLRAFLVYRRG